MGVRKYADPDDGDEQAEQQTPAKASAFANHHWFFNSALIVANDAAIGVALDFSFTNISHFLLRVWPAWTVREENVSRASGFQLQVP